MIGLHLILTLLILMFAPSGLMIWNLIMVSTLVVSSPTLLTITLAFGLYLISLPDKNQNSFYVLLYFYYVALTSLVLAQDHIFLYLSIELLALTSYILSVLIQNKFTIEASLKYFIYNSLASIILLLGICLIYLTTGNIQLVPTYDIGYYLVLFTILFKPSIFPFHFWTVDVYEGVVYPITTLFSVFPKIVFIIILIKSVSPSYLLLSLGTLSLVHGAISAYNQYRIKRLLAYSTTSNSGSLLMLISLGEPTIYPYVVFYLIVYMITTSNIFTYSMGFNILRLNQLFGSYLSTFLSILTISSYGGIPPFIGFITKFVVISISFTNGYHLSMLLVIIYSLISIVYYLSLIHHSRFTGVAAIEYTASPNFHLLRSITLAPIISTSNPESSLIPSHNIVHPTLLLPVF